MLFLMILSTGSWILTIYLAVKYDRNVIVWGIAGAFFSMITLIVLLVSLARNGDFDRRKERKAY